MKKFLFILIFFLISFGCREEEILPYYEVLPVVEVTNPFFDNIYKVRLNNTLTVDGISTTKTWDIQFAGARSGCYLLKWIGEPIEYIVGTHLEFTVQVLYDMVDDGQDGYTPLEGFSDGNLNKSETWVRAFFEVRDKNKPSNRYLGIEEWNDPNNDEYQPPTVVWTVKDINDIPSSGSKASPNSSARIAGFEITECEDCIWTQIK